MPAAPAREPAPPPKTPPPSPLFRPEALAARQTQAFGTVLIEPRVSQSVFAYCALAAVAAILSLLIFGSYTRKAKVNGWLMPNAGLVRVFTPEAGVVSQVLVHEGQQAAAGAPLIKVSGEVHNSALIGARAEAVARLDDREASWRDAKAANAKLFDQQASDLGARLDAVRNEEQQIGEEVVLQRARTDLAGRVLDRMQAMRKRDLIALPRLEQAEQDQLEQRARQKVVEERRLALMREREQLEQSIRELPLRRTLQIGDVERNLSATAQERAEAETRREVTVTAPQSGVVTSIQAELGSAVGLGVPLLSIVPDGVDLEAQLFSPSRAVGFIHAGQRVQLRYQAYPFQKFGVYEGIVDSVSRTALSPAEMPQALAGLSSLVGSGEAVYRVIVKLDHQAVQAYGEAHPLKPGMLLEADVMLESRRLMEWVFDPLYAVTGNWR